MCRPADHRPEQPAGGHRRRQNAGMLAAGAGQAAPSVPPVPGMVTVDRTKVINGFTYDQMIAAPTKDGRTKS